MTRWDDGRVWQEVDAWRWFPPNALRLATAEFEIAVTPGAPDLTYVYGLRVEDAGRVEACLDQLQAEIQARGGTGARVSVPPDSSPADLGDRLRRRGYRPRDATDVLTFELRGPDGAERLPAFREPEGYVIREVASEAEFAECSRLQSAIFGSAPPPPATYEALVQEFRDRQRETGHSERFLVWDGATAVGLGSYQLVGPVARFWGSGVVPEHRQRGLYGAVVRTRCASAAARGAELVLVTARRGTSGPILRRHGFRDHGELRVFDVHW